MEIDSVKLMQRITMTVKLKRHRELKFRLWLATRLLILAAWIGNFNIELEE